jgi:hypothetical protein
MPRFEIMADSACDLTPERAAELGVQLVPFYVAVDGKEYRKEGLEQNVREFYRFVVEHPEVSPKTSLPSLDDYLQAFTPYAQGKRPLLCLCYTGKMSGSVGSARNARAILMDEYPEAEIEVMDSTAATVTQALMVENACAMRDADCSLADTVTWLAGVAPYQPDLLHGRQPGLPDPRRPHRQGQGHGRQSAQHQADDPLPRRRDLFRRRGARPAQERRKGRSSSCSTTLPERNADPDDYRMAVGYGYDEEEGRRLWMQLRAALRARYPRCRVRGRASCRSAATIAVHTGPDGRSASVHHAPLEAARGGCRARRKNGGGRSGPQSVKTGAAGCKKTKQKALSGSAAAGRAESAFALCENFAGKEKRRFAPAGKKAASVLAGRADQPSSLPVSAGCVSVRRISSTRRCAVRVTVPS